MVKTLDELDIATRASNAGRYTTLAEAINDLEARVSKLESGKKGTRKTSKTTKEE